MPFVVTEECILCGACVAGCESDAITEGETQAHIDVDICVECGTCEINCVSDAIVYMNEEQYKVYLASKGAEEATSS